MCACCAGGSGAKVAVGSDGTCSGAIPDPGRFEKRYESRKLRVVDSSAAGARTSSFGGEFETNLDCEGT
jgi:hypothetical protein